MNSIYVGFKHRVKDYQHEITMPDILVNKEGPKKDKHNLMSK